MSNNHNRRESVSLWKMAKVETIEEFYKRKLDWIPDNLRSEIGHFNIFKLQPYVEGQSPSIPYRRRDFYKVMLVMGNSEVHYADKVYEVKKQALSFSNPFIPYKWEHLDKIRSGVYCIFNQHFFHQFGNLNQYSVFQPEGTHLFELTDEQAELLERQFPIDENHQALQFRSASDFAAQLNVHVNHLNRAVKETTEKTTSQVIAAGFCKRQKFY